MGWMQRWDDHNQRVADGLRSAPSTRTKMPAGLGIVVMVIIFLVPGSTWPEYLIGAAAAILGWFLSRTWLRRVRQDGQ